MFGREIPIHVIDFEGAPSYGVVEYGVATLMGGQITDTQTRLCRALAPIDPMDVAVHGITYERSLQYAPFADDFNFFVNLRRQGPLAAHNARYEARLVKMTWALPPIVPAWSNSRPIDRQKELPLLTGEAVAGAVQTATCVELGDWAFDECATWAPWIDSCALARKMAPNLSRYKLSVVVRELGLENELNALAIDRCPAERRIYHCALFDAIASALILKKLLLEGKVKVPHGKLFSVKAV